MHFQIADFVISEEKKFKSGEDSIFKYGQETQKSYPRDGFHRSLTSGVIWARTVFPLFIACGWRLRTGPQSYSNLTARNSRSSRYPL